MMNSEPKRSKNNDNDGINRLTELSDEILVHILSFLPTVDAVRTMSIRRFGKLWTLLPSLQFDDQCESLICSDDTTEEHIHYFTNFVRNVLVLHKKPFLDKFILSVVVDYHNDYKSLFNEMMTWLGFAIDRQVKELIVEIAAVDFGDDDDDDKHYFILPRGVLASQSLVKLNLSEIHINEPRQVHMRSLKTLSLKSVKVTNEVFKKIVSGCPSLQRVHLSNVIGLNELRFAAPNIQELHLTRYSGLLDCPNLKFLDIYLGDLYSSTHLEVVDVSLIQEVCTWLTDFDDFYGLLKKICNAEFFKYTDIFFQPSELKKLDFPQTRWKRLHIDSKLDGDRFLGICNVLKSSPHLEELIVAITQYTYPRHYSDSNMLSLELPPCMMQQLKTVTLCGYAVPCHYLLQLAEFLLISSVTLEEMVILPSKNMNASVGDILTFLKKLSSFPRASTNARVMFGSERCTIMQDQDPEVLRWTLLG